MGSIFDRNVTIVEYKSFLFDSCGVFCMFLYYECDVFAEYGMIDSSKAFRISLVQQ